LRIALFTPFSPEIGGGSAQLRSHLEQLPDLDVQWYYLANEPAPGLRRQWLGEPLTANQFLSDLSARTRVLPGSKARVQQIVAHIEADLYWVVAHYEGISVAAELNDRGEKIHLTVHDDPFGTWIRSERYRAFRPLLWRTFPRLLRAAQSIDVTSWGMRNLYRQKYGVKCFALYRHVPNLPDLDIPRDSRRLTIGHIGTLYRPEPFERFLSASKRVAAETNRSLRIVRIGDSPEIDCIAAEDPGIFQAHGDLNEERAIPLLAACDFLYAMYPAGRRYELFRKTSLPVKVSTYLQSQRPIFAHTPADSTLACVVRQYGIGCVEESGSEPRIAEKIRGLLDRPVPRENYQLAREDLMGAPQVHQLRAALRGEDWQHFPESDCRS
jgi:glycosyltransferase involved in cell wall biosynthesis